MSNKGQFGFVIVLVLAVMLVWVWALILPVAVNPAIDIGLNGTAGADHADGIGFFLRMIPWAVPIIFLIGLFFWGVTR